MCMTRENYPKFRDRPRHVVKVEACVRQPREGCWSDAEAGAISGLTRPGGRFSATGPPKCPSLGVLCSCQVQQPEEAPWQFTGSTTTSTIWSGLHEAHRLLEVASGVGEAAQEQLLRQDFPYCGPAPRRDQAAHRRKRRRSGDPGRRPGVGDLRHLDQRYGLDEEQPLVA